MGYERDRLSLHKEHFPHRLSSYLLDVTGQEVQNGDLVVAADGSVLLVGTISGYKPGNASCSIEQVQFRGVNSYNVKRFQLGRPLSRSQKQEGAPMRSRRIMRIEQ